MATPLALLKKLAEASEGCSLDVVSPDDVVALRSALGTSEKTSADIWTAASADGVSLESVVGTLNVAMSGNPSSPGALAAAAAYTAMLASPGCPAFSLFTSLGFGAALRVLKAACARVGNGGSNDDGVNGEDGSAVASTPASSDGVDLVRCIMVDLAVFFDAFPLRDMPDVLKTVIECLTEVGRCRLTQ